MIWQMDLHAPTFGGGGYASGPSLASGASAGFTTALAAAAAAMLFFTPNARFNRALVWVGFNRSLPTSTMAKPAPAGAFTGIGIARPASGGTMGEPACPGIVLACSLIFAFASSFAWRWRAGREAFSGIGQV